MTTPIPPDWRVALEQAADELDMAENALLCSSFHNAADRAKKAARNARLALLAQPEPEVVGPTDEELMQGEPKQVTDDDLDLLVIAIQALRPESSPDSHDLTTVDRGREILRAWLARWGRLAPAPAGERQAAPVPVAVSERLPQPEDCDAEGQCWAWDYLAERWGLWPLESIADGFYHWLPFNALPLPSVAINTLRAAAQLLHAGGAPEAGDRLLQIAAELEDTSG